MSMSRLFFSTMNVSIFLCRITCQLNMKEHCNVPEEEAAGLPAMAKSRNGSCGMKRFAAPVRRRKQTRHEIHPGLSYSHFAMPWSHGLRTGRPERDAKRHGGWNPSIHLPMVERWRSDCRSV